MRHDKGTLKVDAALALSVILCMEFSISPASAPAQEDANVPPNPYAVERIPPPQTARIPGPPVAQPTGITVESGPNALAGDGSLQAGGAFGPNVRVWDDSHEESRPSLAVSPRTGDTFIAFQHNNGADWDIYLARSSDSGLTWNVVRLTNSTADETDPSLAVTSTGAFALFYQQDQFPERMYFFQSLNGNAWESYYLDLNPASGLSQISFPSAATETPAGAYPDGVMLAVQVYCNSTANCGGGAHTITWLGSSAWSASPPTFDLGGPYWIVKAARTSPNDIVNLQHPSAAWSSAGFFMGMDDQWWHVNEWRYDWLIVDEAGGAFVNGWLSGAKGTGSGLWGGSYASGQNHMTAATFLNASLFPGNPTNHNIVYFASDDGGLGYPNAGQLDSAPTNQRSVAVSCFGGELSVTYYSDNFIVLKHSTDVGLSWTAPLPVSDNNGTVVNDDRSTSVFTHGGNGSYVAWQDDRDGNVNIYAVIGNASFNYSDTYGPRVRNLRTIPQTYIYGYSPSLEVLALIDDTGTGSSNITAAELVLTDQSVTRSADVDWLRAWAMNLTGVNRRPFETAWLWANDTAAQWPLNSCLRFWVRGQDSEGNWGTGSFIDVCVRSPGPPQPPEMTKAELTGRSYWNVTLTWSSSPDDGGNNFNVVAYDIWRSEDINGPFSEVATVSATRAAIYSWSDLGRGHGDLHIYFYYVVADTGAYISTPTRLAGKYYRTMEDGKQLVSIPLEQAIDDPAVVFQTIAYSYVRTYVAGTPNPWWCHKPGRFDNSLTHITVEQGYWIDLEGPGTMTVAGLVPQNKVMTLKSGWNMIGFPSFYKSYTLSDLDAALGGRLQLVEIYDPTAGPYYLQKIVRSRWPMTSLLQGYAFMVRVSVDVDWAVPGA